MVVMEELHSILQLQHTIMEADIQLQQAEVVAIRLVLLTTMEADIILHQE